ncbi:competence/damage-inducible protein A [Lederbergia wuyishanensis]|uniref:Putative competence-damage inducible protein n=1 Tax=Lederbergia wuyishanensis TaxID=1347903 RepID=A0ABU0CZZ0_9BACI|nr:competence/damage-inducible protein A [Lederbergia wuyishanensis]MCJ8006337.1 competence/damage-inducible protein A [Lederbergia wuyishanensis]MDQ0341706.1 nicotinamide-nucleotide amidase [Lederbergia wuyishanensis]
MNAEIIAVGTELLLGQIVNTNAKFLSEQLAEIGVNVYYHTVVGDNPTRLEQAIQHAEDRADLIIFTGGLGPTKDDLTKETIAKHIGKTLVLDEDAMQTILTYFQKTGRTMTENNKKQALVLDGAKVLPNEHGMAPGMFLYNKEHSYMLLPGPPHEMQPMFRKYGRLAIMDQLETNERIESRVLRYFGIGESQLEVEIEDILDSQTNPTVAPLAGDNEVTLRITARHHSESEAQRMIDAMEKKVNDRVGKYFYGYDQTSIMKELLKVLEEKKMTIACAESLTGGLFQAEMTSIVGVSTMLIGGIVCYSNDAKIKLCKVKKETIDNFGVVSKECAIELAENVRSILSTNIGISFTGVAGPDSLEGHQAGTVWIGISFDNKPSKAFLLNLAGSRNGNQKRSVMYGCHYLLQELKNNN